MALVALPAILMVAATAVSAVGAIASGQAQANASKYQANVAMQNANAAQQQAQQAAMLQQQKTQKMLGATTAAYGASGVTSEGSPLDVLASSASNAELDRQTILYQGHVRAAGYTSDAQLDNMAASSATTNSYFSAAGALLSGGAKAYGRSPGAGLGGSGDS